MAARILRWLLFLPGGDRERGLREMVGARANGQLLQGEADFQLHTLYLWYEKKPTEALKLLEALDAKYPANPVFRQRIAELLSGYLHDHAASADSWRDLVARARARTVYSASAIETRARRGLDAELRAREPHPTR